MIIVQDLAAFNDFVRAILTRVDVEVVPHEELAVQATEHDLLVNNVAHIEQFGNVNVSVLQFVLVRGLIHLKVNLIQLVLYIFLHDGPLVVALLLVCHRLFDVQHHRGLANLEQVIDVFLQPFDRDGHVIALDRACTVSSDLMAHA